MFRFSKAPTETYSSVQILINNDSHDYDKKQAFNTIRNDSQADMGFTAQSDIFLGNFKDSGDQPLDGIIAEVLVFDKTLSTSQTTKVEKRETLLG